jgi:hypothetical protein
MSDCNGPHRLHSDAQGHDFEGNSDFSRFLCATVDLWISRSVQDSCESFAFADRPDLWRGSVIAVKVLTSLIRLLLTLIRIYNLQARRAGVVLVDRFLAAVHRANALLTLEGPSSVRVLLYRVFEWSHVSLCVLSLLSLGTLPRHTRREPRIFGRL